MQTSVSGGGKQTAKARETGAGVTVASVNAAQSPRQSSYAPGMNQLPEVDEARRCSSSIRKESDSRVAGGCTARSRDIGSKNSNLFEGSGNQRQAEGSGREDRGNLCDNGHTQHSCGLASRSYIKSDISMDTFVPHRELSEDGNEKDGQVQINLESVEKSVFTPEPPGFGDSTSVSRNPHNRDASTTAGVDPLAKIETAVASTAYGESGSGGRKSSDEAEKSMEPLRNQLRCFSSSKDAPRHRSRGICPTALVASRTLPVVRVETELAGSGRGRASGSGDVAEATVPSAPTGCLAGTSAFPGDAVTTDTREGTSRDRRSAQFLREMLGVVDKDQAGSSRGREGDGGNVNSAATVPNPLHHRHSASRASDSESIGDTHHRHGNETSGTQSSATRRELHGRNVGNVAGGDRDEYNTDSLVDGRSLGSYRGELEWLCVPSLFYLFSNIIKWNELRLQRRTSQAPLEENRSRSSDESFSLASIWTPHREQELHVLEDRISFSVFELEGVYLNPFLVRWSKPKLRSLVADVVSTWEKEGPYSAEFDRVSSRLFDAISTEQTCHLRSTCLLSVRQWLGSAQHRWGVTCVLTALFAVSILCIVFLGVFGRTQAVSIVFSTMLCVAVVLMCMVAVVVLHHNTYADAASRYFREEVVRAAQQRMEEEEMAEKRDVGSRSGYGHRGAVRASRDAAGNGCRSYTAGDDDTGVDDEYMEDEISLAVRNLRALTEGSTHPATNAPPYYRLSDRPHSGKCDSGGAGGGFEDDKTLADGNYVSLTSRSLQTGDKVKQQFEDGRENRLLLSCGTFEQHQGDTDQCESHGVHERMSTQQALRPTKQATPSSTSGAAGGQARQSTSDSCGSGRQEQLTRGGRDGEKIVMDAEQPLQQLADLPENVNVTALLFCRSVGVLSQVALSLWERNFMLLRVRNLQALHNTGSHGSERCRVVLIHAPDVPEGSDDLKMALSWLRMGRRPVFFFSRLTMGYPASVPFSARLMVPFSSTAFNALLLAGIGVGSEHGCVSSPLLPQQEQERHEELCPSQPFQVPPYTLGRRLGGGAFGNVFEAEMEHTGAKCAVKRMYLKEDSNQDEEQQGNTGVAGVCAGGSGTLAAGANAPASPRAAEVEEGTGGATTAVGSQLRDIAQEVEIMSSLQHPSIVRYYYCERDDNCISIFMELCTGGSLRSLIHSGKLVNPPEIKHLLREIISAVSYLHNMHIVHRDLKPDNVLFRQGHIKITDFGTAVHKHGGDLRVIRGTFAYMAPEILVGDPYGRACDVWSIGCIAAEVLSVELPQHALGLPEMCEYYRAMGENSELAIECDVPGVRDFLLACLQRNPSQRSTAAELFYHPILQARDTSIHDWMVEVVARRRRIQQQQQALHRNGLGSRTGGGAAGPGGNHHASSNGPNQNGGMSCANPADRFGLHSVGSAESLDSSKLV
ncbi:putative protein kinase [Leishmania mexicana MHOM/GT/2001/U1103]|uniref:Protein kinase domain-containing protein n=1 Tax=Leishmania mexicana (strain MHOM/GT/2001/U1103) TaxID=929439 RepID=E9AJL9_LEIMU|nr:putative protein kinase [Leishmania mexicana MHOM/GT/2001/U1103]CBZ23118.1 putative protein kinase [Leishmania mexicana MHOM/GT/2001/U1103]